MGYGKLVRQNQLQKALLQLVLHAVIDYTRSDASFYSTKTWSRIGPWGSFVDLHWSISLAYTSNILLSWTLKLGMALPRCPPPRGYAPGGNRILIAGYRPVQEFMIERSSCAHRFWNSN